MVNKISEISRTIVSTNADAMIPLLCKHVSVKDYIIHVLQLCPFGLFIQFWVSFQVTIEAKSNVFCFLLESIFF